MIYQIKMFGYTCLSWCQQKERFWWCVGVYVCSRMLCSWDESTVCGDNMCFIVHSVMGACRLCLPCVNAPGWFWFYNLVVCPTAHLNCDKEPRRRNGPRLAPFPWIHGTLLLHPGQGWIGKGSTYVYSYVSCWCSYTQVSTVHKLENTVVSANMERLLKMNSLTFQLQLNNL